MQSGDSEKVGKGIGSNTGQIETCFTILFYLVVSQTLFLVTPGPN